MYADKATADADGDTVPDGCDACPGSDDALDADAEISTHDIHHSRKLAARATARQVVLVSELQIASRCMDQNAW